MGKSQGSKNHKYETFGRVCSCLFQYADSNSLSMPSLCVEYAAVYRVSVRRVFVQYGG
jgi:hypothetical protein